MGAKNILHIHHIILPPSQIILGYAIYKNVNAIPMFGKHVFKLL